jgi:predicted Zn-dependent peptidase
LSNSCTFTPELVSTTLDSGLEVLGVRLPHAQRTVLQLLTSVGSRFDPPSLRGISHFLEHMLYRGTSSRPSPHALAHAFESLGGTLEAATYVDHGVLVLDLPSENVAQALPLFCEVFTSPILQGIDIERGIVREEILETLDDDGVLIDADELGHQLCFGDNALGCPITGGLTELERFDEQALRAHHVERYTTRSSVFCVAGPIDSNSLLPAIERGFASVPAGTRPAFESPAVQAEPRFRFTPHVSSQTELRVIFRAPGQHDPAEPALELLLRVLDDGMSTRLYQQICNDLGLCYDVSAYYETWQDCGAVEVAASCTHDRAPDLLAELLELLRRLRDEGPSDSELQVARNRHRWQIQQLLEDPAEIANFYGLARLMGLAPTLQARLEEVEAVTIDQVRAAARRILAPSGLSVVAVGQQQKKAQARMQRLISTFK